MTNADPSSEPIADVVLSSNVGSATAARAQREWDDTVFVISRDNSLRTPLPTGSGTAVARVSILYRQLTTLHSNTIDLNFDRETS